MKSTMMRVWVLHRGLLRLSQLGPGVDFLNRPPEGRFRHVPIRIVDLV
jgi:hypothetical protein